MLSNSDIIALCTILVTGFYYLVSVGTTELFVISLYGYNPTLTAKVRRGLKDDSILLKSTSMIKDKSYVVSDGDDQFMFVCRSEKLFDFENEIVDGSSSLRYYFESYSTLFAIINGLMVIPLVPVLFLFVETFADWFVTKVSKKKRIMGKLNYHNVRIVMLDTFRNFYVNARFIEHGDRNITMTFLDDGYIYQYLDVMYKRPDEMILKLLPKLNSNDKYSFIKAFDNYGDPDILGSICMILFLSLNEEHYRNAIEFGEIEYVSYINFLKRWSDHTLSGYCLLNEHGYICDQYKSPRIHELDPNNIQGYKVIGNKVIHADPLPDVTGYKYLDYYPVNFKLN